MATCDRGVESPDFGITFVLALVMLALALLMRRVVGCACARWRRKRRAKQGLLRHANNFSNNPLDGREEGGGGGAARGVRVNRIRSRRKQGGADSDTASDSGSAAIPPGSDTLSSGIIGQLVAAGRLQHFKPKRWRMNLDAEQLGLCTAPSALSSLARRMNIPSLVSVHSRPIVAGVSASLPSGVLTAVLSPPGGLSSRFLRLLAKKGAGGETTGRLLVNGHANDISECVPDIGYVPAAPELHPELTVRETLKFYAKLRLPGSMPDKTKFNMVHDVLELLGLLHLQDTRVGTASQARRVSSSYGWDGEDAAKGSHRETAAGEDEDGECIPWEARRLLSLGVEMVADPALLCAEAPLDGLSPIAAARALSALRAMAKNGANVLVALASSRSEVFATFDRILLLAADGSTAYLGPPFAVGAYFSSLGYTEAPGSAIVDHVVDILSGFAQPSEHPLRALGVSCRLPVQPHELGSIWQRRLEAENLPAACLRAAQSAAGESSASARGRGRTRSDLETGPQQGRKPSAVSGTLEAFELDTEAVAPQDALAALRASAVPSQAASSGRQRIPLAAAATGTAMGQQGYTPRAQLGSWRELVAFVQRSAQQLLRQPVTLMVDILLVMVPGLVLGLLYQDFQLDDIPRIAQLIVLAVGMASAMTSTRLFGLERAVWVREAGMGLNTLWYFCGKATAHLPEEFLSPLAFLMWFYTFSSPRISLAYIYACLLAVVYCTSGVGMFCSTVLPLRAATMASVLIVIVFAMLAGTDPPLPRLRESGGVFTEVLVGVSYSRYAVEALTVFETEQWPAVWNQDVSSLLDQRYGFDPSAGPTDLLVLCIMGFVLRLASLAALSYTAASARSGRITAASQ